MSLGEQLREVTGREIEVVWDSELQKLCRIGTGTEWRTYLDRYTDLVDFREVLEGRADLGSFALCILSFQRGGMMLEFRRPNEAFNRRKLGSVNCLVVAIRSGQ